MLLRFNSQVGLYALLLSVLSFITATNAVLFTPEALISAPRRGTAVPNAAGTLALYTLSEYSFETHKTARGLYVLDLKNGSSTLFSNSSAVSNAAWLGDGNTIIWLISEDDGTTSFTVGDATKPSATPIPAGSVPGSIDGLKIANLGNSSYGLVFSGSAAPNGSLYNSELAATPLSTGRIYTTLFVRHWDTYITPIRNSVFYAVLKVNAGGYTLSEAINTLNGTGLESPVPPFGGTDNYDVSKKGLAFLAKDPKLGQANTTKSDVYFVPLSTFTESKPELKIINTPGLEGASAVPTFSPSGTSLAFVRMKDISYESDKNRILLVPDVTKGLTALEFYANEEGTGDWDRSPGALLWSADGKTIYASAENEARGPLFSLPSSPKAAKDLPKIVFGKGYVTDFHILGKDKLLISSNSFIDNSLFSSVDPILAGNSKGAKGITTISSNTDNGKKYGLSQDQISEFYYDGAGDYKVQAWIIKPSFFKKGETYPLAFYIHGGPQGSTAETWSTRWNMAVFAEQGYVVVAFNPTGSTGFGQALVDGIQNQWGGRPYYDLVNGWDYIVKNLPYVDTDRAIALGASYGGYMVNWIQGHDLGRKFKALFTHDGVFSTLAQYSSEELWFMDHEYNGTLWKAWDNYARYNPANHTDQWATPHLIVHNELDYRLPISEGIAAFNVLQTRGVPSKLLSFPDENHWVLKPENSLVWHKTVFDWLNKYVGLPQYSKDDDVAYRSLLQNGEWI